MTKTQFLEKLGMELGISPAKLTESAPLSSFPAWDSMGRMAVVAMFDTELGVDLPQGELRKCQTVGDLTALASGKIDS
jgi:acyl carrier protein